MNRIDLSTFALTFSEKLLLPVSLEHNPVGFCDRCGLELESLAYFSIEREHLVSARCMSGHLVLIRYDLDWGWLSDLELEASVAETPGEVAGIGRCSEGKPDVGEGEAACAEKGGDLRKGPELLAGADDRDAARVQNGSRVGIEVREKRAAGNCEADPAEKGSGVGNGVRKEGAMDISSISREMLEAVFTQAEIRDMLACEKGGHYTRQNIYRARAKFERFERLFGIRIRISESASSSRNREIPP